MPDWTTFTRRININAPAQKVYDAWGKPGQLTEWYLEKADYFQPDGSKRPPEEHYQKGDTYEWKWYTADFIEKGIVLEADGQSCIIMSFGDNEVSIELKGRGSRTAVLLTQSGIATDEESKMNIYMGCSQGWAFWLVNLKAWLEHGILLNQREPLQEGESPFEMVNC